MEHAQRVAMHIYFIKDVVLVLILILMEHAQRYKKNLGSKEEQNSCLNPYFNGTCSKML